MYKQVLLWVVLLSMSACVKEEFCIEPNAVLLNMNFKTYSSDNKLVDTPLINAYVYNTDTNFYFADNVEGLLTVNVVLNRKKVRQTYIIQQDIVRDTLQISYDTELNFISNGCGYQSVHTIKTVNHTRNSIDSVNIEARQVNSSLQNPHLEIIYK